LKLQHILTIDPDKLLQAVTMCLLADHNEQLKQHLLMQRTLLDPTSFLVEKRFATFLTLAPVIPFQQSPLSLDSFASILTRPSAFIGLGAYAAFVISGPTPLIFVTVPAGMIFFGAAAGVAKALESGLQKLLESKILQLSQNKADARS
jgi:hypothetical protein